MKKNTEPKLEKRFYDLRSAAEYLGVSAQFLYNRTSQKSELECPVPFRKIGGKIVFDIKDLERF